jgi:hypothetical protein
MPEQPSVNILFNDADNIHKERPLVRDFIAQMKKKRDAYDRGIQEARASYKMMYEKQLRDQAL